MGLKEYEKDMSFLDLEQGQDHGEAGREGAQGAGGVRQSGEVQPGFGV